MFKSSSVQVRSRIIFQKKENQISFRWRFKSDKIIRLKLVNYIGLDYTDTIIQIKWNQMAEYEPPEPKRDFKGFSILLPL